MTLGGAAQVVAVHCPNERTLDLTVCSYNSQSQYGLHSTMLSGNYSLFLVASIIRY